MRGLAFRLTGPLFTAYHVIVHDSLGEIQRDVPGAPRPHGSETNSEGYTMSGGGQFTPDG